MIKKFYNSFTIYQRSENTLKNQIFVLKMESQSSVHFYRINKQVLSNFINLNKFTARYDKVTNYYHYY